MASAATATTTEATKPSPATGESEPAPAQPDSDESPAKTAEQLLGEGKKCLAAGDASGAVEAFQEACSILAERHGQVSKELAEPYFLYGRALLDLARADSTVLGSAIPVPGEAESEEMDEGNEEEGDDPAQTSSNDIDSSTNEAEPPSEEAGTSKEDAPASSSDNEPANTSTEEGAEVSSSNDLPGTSDGASGETPDDTAPNEEEESDLKLAWEVLELARVICQKEEGDEFKLKLADVNLLLGEVGMESDQYDQAIGDIQSCLQLREFVLEATDRRMAEVHFNLGLAYSFAKQANSSIVEYKKSKEILEKRIGELQKQIAEDGTTEDNRKKLEQEVKELQELLPDLDAKVADIEELKQALEDREREAEEEESAEAGGDEATTTAIGFGPSSNADKQATNDDGTGKLPVQDITHLLRKRSAEDAPENAKLAKRPCLEGDENTDATSTTGKVNGSNQEAATTTSEMTTAEQ